MTESRTHRLDGLEPDNLLAFLALLGLLRSIELSRPDWRPRAYWTIETPPLRPIVTFDTDISSTDLSLASLEGLEQFRRALLPFSWPRNASGRSM